MALSQQSMESAGLAEYTSLLIRTLRTSQVLQRVLPEVRKLALTESLRRARSIEAALQMLLEVVVDSPYITAEMGNRLADLMLTGQWSMIREVLLCDEAIAPPRLGEFETYRSMVVAMFSTSRRTALLSEERRRMLGAAIHAATSVEQLKDICISSLAQAVTMDEPTRARCANNMFDDRYDLLLLPDCYDVDEEPRRGRGRSSMAAQMAGGSSEVLEEDECPVCLSTNVTDRQLPCQHRLCHACMDDWAARHGEPFPCPMCRAPTRRENAIRLRGS